MTRLFLGDRNRQPRLRQALRHRAALLAAPRHATTQVGLMFSTRRTTGAAAPRIQARTPLGLTKAVVSEGRPSTGGESVQAAACIARCEPATVTTNRWGPTTTT